MIKAIIHFLFNFRSVFYPGIVNIYFSAAILAINNFIASKSLLFVLLLCNDSFITVSTVINSFIVLKEY